MHRYDELKLQAEAGGAGSQAARIFVSEVELESNSSQEWTDCYLNFSIHDGMTPTIWFICPRFPKMLGRKGSENDLVVGMFCCSVHNTVFPLSSRVALRLTYANVLCKFGI